MQGINKVYKPSYVDYGVRLTGLIRLPFDQAIGGVYKGLYYDGGEYPAFEPRYVVIAQEALEKDWIEVTDE